MTTTKSYIRWIFISALAVAAVVLAAYLLRPRPLQVDTAMVTRGPIADVVADQGTARVRQSYVVSAPVGGQLDRVPLEVGDRIVANTTVVARIRPPAPEFLDPRTRAEREAAVDAAESALTSATAQRDKLAADATRARDTLKRDTGLATKGIVTAELLENSQSEAEQADNALRAAEADILTKRANLDSAQMALENPKAGNAEAITVTSPASGVVTQVMQQSERDVTVGTPLVQIGATAGLEAAIEFLSQDAVKVHPGQKAEIYNWGGQADIPAEVRLVEPQGFTKVSALGVEEQRTLVMLQFTGPPSAWAGLAPGYRVWGRVYLRQVDSAVLAPLGALIRDHGEWAVYRIEDGKARLRHIQVGTLTDTAAEILGGIAPGDQLILYPSDVVHDGLAVQPHQ